MTLNFDILTNNNANWGFDGFAAAPESSSQPALFSFGHTPLPAATAAPLRPLPAVPRPAAELLATPALPAAPPLALPSSLHTLHSFPAAATDNEDSNVSPLKNAALEVPLQASDPIARSFDSNLYVASLPDWFTDADLFELFKRFGPILSTKVMCHKGTHHCKGYGFVLFQRTDDAAVARSEMIGHVVGGNKIQVRRARSAASAPLSDPLPSSAGNGFSAEAPHNMLLSPPTNASTLSANHQFAPPSPQSLSPLYGGGPTYMLANQSRTPATPSMLMAIPNGRAVMQGGDSVVYMVLTSPQLQSSNIIF